MQNILFLKRAVLGVSAVEGERNMIEVNALSALLQDALLDYSRTE